MKLVLAITGATLLALAGALWLPSDSPLDAAPDIQGDVDCDLQVDAVDALHVLRDTAGLSSTAGCLAVGDVDCDGDLDAVDALHILRYVAGLPDQTPANCPDIGTSLDESDVAVDSVALSFLAADGATPITEIPVDTEFIVEVSTAITNSGPAIVDISVQSSLAIPADCSPTPADVDVGISNVGLGQSRTSDVQFTVSCSSPSQHLFTGSGTVSITSGETDTSPANDGPVTDDASIPVTADVDLAVSGVTVTAPPTATQNVAFDVTVSGSVDNPAAFAVTADITFDLASTSEDCPTTTPVTDQDQALATGPNAVEHTFSVTCTGTGAVDFTGDISVAADQLHVTDGNAANDSGTDVASTDVKSVPVAVDDAATVDEDSGATTIDVLANDTDADGDTLSVDSVTDPADGTAVISGGGTTVEYTPDADFCGTDTFDYVVTDGLFSDTGTVTVTVTCINDPPVAIDDAATVDEDSPATTIDVLANDTDVEGDTLSVSAVGDPPNGVAVISPGGVDYTPDPNFCGDDTFDYTVDDANGGTDVGTVTVTVTCVNDAPTCAGADVTTDEDITSSPFSLNCSDVDGDPLSCSVVTPGTLGTLNITDCGSATYTPNADANGSDSVTYGANDGTTDSADATVSVTITPVNDAPTCAGASVTTDEDTPSSPFSLNCSDVDGDPLTCSVVTPGTLGTLNITDCGSATYTPNADANGSDSVTYGANDGTTDSAAATVSVTITPVNDAPVAVADVEMTDEDTPVTIPVLANDTDVEGDTLSVSAVGDPPNGAAVISPGGVDYTPDADYCGPDTFDYTVDDGNGGTDIGTVTVDVTCVNDPPVAVDDAATLDEDSGATTIDVLANDINVDADTLSVDSVTDPAGGTADISGGGTTVDYTPDADFCGTDTFDYVVTDGLLTDTGTVTVTVTCVNDGPPVAGADAAMTDEDTPVTISVLVNDTDIDGDTLTVTGVTPATNGTAVISGGGTTVDYTPDPDYCGPDTFDYTVDDGNGGSDTGTVNVTVNCVNDAPTCADASVTTSEDSPSAPFSLNCSDVDGDSLTCSVVTPGTLGTLDITDCGSATYTPNPDANGSDSVIYRATDGTADSGDATVSVTITPVNDAPTCAGADVTTDEDTTSTPFSLNCSDVDDDPLTCSVVTTGTLGTLNITDCGSATYTPTANANGSDSVTYRANDGTADSADAAVSVTITPVNDAPTCAGAGVTTDEDTTSAPFSLNCFDVDGDSLTCSVVTPGSKGTLDTTSCDSATYTPNADANGSDSVTYGANDGTADSADAAVSVTIIPVNDSPVAVDDAATTVVDTPITISVLVNDTDIENDILTVTGITTPPTNGTAVVSLDATTIEYTPDTAFCGDDTFIYTVSDGNGGTDTATVTVTVTCVSDASVDSVVVSFFQTDGVTSITDVPVDTNFVIEVSTTVTNNGPATVDLEVTNGLAIPADCTPTPTEQSEPFAGVPATDSVISDAQFTVSCSSPSQHLFTGSGAVSITSGETDADPANNGPVIDDSSIPVTADVDLAVSGVLVTAPPTATQNVAFDVTVSGTLTNPAPFAVTADITFDLTSTSADCTTTSPVTDQDQALASGANAVDHVFSVTCTTTGTFSFTGEMSVAVDQLHVMDSIPANNTGSNSGSTEVQSADAMVDTVVVSFFAADGMTPITDIPVDANFVVQVSTTVTNNGPATVDLDVTNGLAIPMDCTPAPVDMIESFAAVAATGTETSDAQFTVSCSSPSFHQFTGSGSVSITSGPVDTNPANDGPVTANPSIPVTADVDLADSDVTVTAPLTATQNVPFDVTVSGSVNNPAGFDVTADVTFGLTALPAGCSTATPVTNQGQALVSGANAVEHIFSVTCASTGLFEFTGDVSVAVDQLHVTDPDSANDIGSDVASTDVHAPQAAVTVNKAYSDNTLGEVQVVLTCDSGMVFPPGTGQTGSAGSMPGSPPTFTVTGFLPGTACSATEDPVPPGYIEDDTDCAVLPLTDGADVDCTITNTLVTPTPTPTPTVTP